MISLSCYNNRMQNTITMTIKITTKQFAGFKAARRRQFGISANDNYNKQTFGITADQYYAILSLCLSMTGDGQGVTLPMVRRFIDGEKVVGCRIQNDQLARLQRAFG